MSDYMTPYRLAIWQHLARRDKDESTQAQHASPPPMFVDRLADEYAATDELAEFSIKHDWSKT